MLLLLLCVFGVTSATLNLTVLFNHRVWINLNPTVFIARSNPAPPPGVSPPFSNLLHQSFPFGSAVDRDGAPLGVYVYAGGSLQRLDANGRGATVTTLCRVPRGEAGQSLYQVFGRAPDLMGVAQINSSVVAFGSFDATTCVLDIGPRRLPAPGVGSSVVDTLHRRLFWLPQSGSLLKNLTVMEDNGRVTVLNLTSCRIPLREYHFPGAFYSKIDDALYIISQSVFTQVVTKIVVDPQGGSMLCTPVIQHTFTNADASGFAFNDEAGLIWMSDGFEGWGVIDVRRKTTFRGSFGWFYNTNWVDSAALLIR